jgi:hypothetical protein
MHPKKGRLRDEKRKGQMDRQVISIHDVIMNNDRI